MIKNDDTWLSSSSALSRFRRHLREYMDFSRHDDEFRLFNASFVPRLMQGAVVRLHITSFGSGPALPASLQD